VLSGRPVSGAMRVGTASGAPLILIAESAEFDRVAADLLASVGEVRMADLDRRSLLAAVGDVQVLWVRLRHRIDAEVLDRAPQLSVVVTPTTGLTHIDLRAAARRQVHILSLRGEHAFLADVRATAEHAIALMLAGLRHIPAACRHTAQGGWDRDRFHGDELHGATVGVIGYGRLGRLVARYSSAFDARVLVCDRPGRNLHVAAGIEQVELEELLHRSDIVTLHVDVHPETVRLIGERELRVMRPGAYLVNTSRGEIVDEAALLRALNSRHLAGAALDVLTDEQRHAGVDHPLIAYSRVHDNLVITPHIGGATRQSMAKTERHLAKKLVAAIEAGNLETF
jgi:D-3-phosphoglycerate dehydrogenase